MKHHPQGARERFKELQQTDDGNKALSSAFGVDKSLRRRAIVVEQWNLRAGFLGCGRKRKRNLRRRAKNAAHRVDDIEFVFEIGSGLFSEDRQLQSLLGERDKAIEDVKEEKEAAKSHGS
ncbi:hypothetical protein C8J56DRAFT_904381 [Mycena floridula]|nr:hypothetical protein C8J56DRAFT_904381 [Mycena floridula]